MRADWMGLSIWPGRPSRLHPQSMLLVHTSAALPPAGHIRGLEVAVGCDVGVGVCVFASENTRTRASVCV